MLKNKYKTVILSAIIFGALILGCNSKASCAAAGFHAGAVQKSGGPVQNATEAKLKKIVIKYYLKDIPLKFRRYFHFGDFKFSGPLKNIFSYFISPVTYNPGFAGEHTAIIKLIAKNKGKAGNPQGLLEGIAYAAFKVWIYAPVAVASRTVGKFQILKPGDIKIAYANVSDINDGYYLKKEEAVNTEAKFTIFENSVLSKINTERRRIINFGDIVNIVYKSRRYGLNLETKGMALQAGPYGSKIRVKNMESGVIVNGTVKSNKTVTVR